MWEKGWKRTEAVESGADEHENVPLGTTRSGVILVRDLIRRDEHPQSADAHCHALHIQVTTNHEQRRMSTGVAISRGEETYEKLCPVVLGSHVYPGEEETDGDGPCVEEHAGEEGGVLIGFDD